MAYEEKCGSCDYLKDIRCDKYQYDKSEYEQGHCIMLKQICWPDDEKCSYYKNSNNYGCYITTIVTQILGLDDNCKELETLRLLRSQMQQDNRCIGLLYEYDVIGPEISKSIKKQFNETNNIELWILIFNFYIQPTIHLYEDNKYDKAIERYKEMFDSLKDYFGYKNIPYTIPQEYDYKNGGHGFNIKKKTSI